MDKNNNFEQRVKHSMEASIATKQALLQSAEIVTMVAKVSEIMIAALKGGNKIMLFGNGGSAGDAQHIAAELVGRFAFDRPPLPALALSVNSSCVTAIGNDYGYDLVFSRQLEALARPGDVAIGISTSGNSPNVVQALEAAKKMKVHAVGMTGRAGGKLVCAAEHCIRVPSDETPRIQESHILIGHILSELVEQEIFHDKGRVSRS